LALLHVRRRESVGGNGRRRAGNVERGKGIIAAAATTAALREGDNGA
jgi:hypothetical protein